MKCPRLVVSVCLVIAGWLSVCHAQFGKLETSWGRTVDTIKADTIPVPDIGVYTVQALVLDGQHYFIDVKEADTTNPFSFTTSVGLDCFTRESKSGAYKVGLIPGVGYGIRYKPKWWTVTKYLLSFDIFIQGLLSDDLETHEGSDYFNIDILPVITLIDWFGVGFGKRIKIGLEDVPHDHRWIFSFGIKKATQ